MNSQLARLLKLERPLISFDYETTGVDTSTCRAVSLGMKVHKPDGRLQYWRTLIDPEMDIPPASIAVHHITDEAIQTGCGRCWSIVAQPTPENPDNKVIVFFTAEQHPHEKCEKFRPVPRYRDIAQPIFQGFSDADFLGYNVQYDLKVTVAELARAGKTFDYSKAYIIDPFHIWRLLEPRHLSDAVERFAEEGLNTVVTHEDGSTVPFRANAHDAMTDVEGHELAFIGQLTNHPRSDRLPRTVRELHELCFPRDPNAFDSTGKFVFNEMEVLCFGFGKHKGKPVVSELGYIKWMYGSDFSPEVKSICEQILSGSLPVRS